jgi:hypothetical protein
MLAAALNQCSRTEYLDHRLVQGFRAIDYD